MTPQTIPQTVLFPDLFDKPLVATFDRQHASSDGGAVLLKAAERVYGLLAGFARCLVDRRELGKIRHTLTELLGQRIQLWFKLHRPPRPRSPDAPTRRGRWPSPRRPPGSSPTRVSAATPDGPTPARCGAWTPGAGPPRLTTPRWPSTSASSSRRAARPPPPPWPSPPSGFGPSSPASRPPPGQRPPACWAATGARPPPGAGARPPRCARTGSPRFSPPPNGPARTAGGVESHTTAHRRGRRDAVIASLLFMGGLRRSEVAALRWADVTDARDGDGVLLTVRTSKTNHEGNAADVRYLKNGAANAIRTLRAADADAAPTDRVIGLSPLQIQRRFTAAARAAGIAARVTAHSGRVGLASELTARGASTTEVMLAGNWKTARMVAHYSAGATAERGAVRKYL